MQPPEGELILREIGARHRDLAQEHLKGEKEGHGPNQLSAISLCLTPQAGLDKYYKERNFSIFMHLPK